MTMSLVRAVARLGPPIEDVAQVDVGEQRRDGRSLPRSRQELDLSVFFYASFVAISGSGGVRAVVDAMFEGTGRSHSSLTETKSPLRRRRQ